MHTHTHLFFTLLICKIVKFQWTLAFIFRSPYVKQFDLPSLTKEYSALFRPYPRLLLLINFFSYEVAWNPAEPDFGEARGHISPYRRDVTYLRGKNRRNERSRSYLQIPLGRRPKLHSRNQFAGTLDADDVSPTDVHYWHPLAMTSSPASCPSSLRHYQCRFFVGFASRRVFEYYSFLRRDSSIKIPFVYLGQLSIRFNTDAIFCNYNPSRKSYPRIEPVTYSWVGKKKHLRTFARERWSRERKKSAMCVVEIRNSADDRPGTAGLYQLRVFVHSSILMYHVEGLPKDFAPAGIYKRRAGLHRAAHPTAVTFSNWKRFVSPRRAVWQCRISDNVSDLDYRCICRFLSLIRGKIPILSETESVARNKRHTTWLMNTQSVNQNKTNATKLLLRELQSVWYLKSCLQNRHCLWKVHLTSASWCSRVLQIEISKVCSSLPCLQIAINHHQSYHMLYLQCIQCRML